MYKIHMSPTIVSMGRFRISIQPGDHGGPHVHVNGRGAEAKIYLENLEVQRSRGFTRKDLDRIVEFIRKNHERLMEAWFDYNK